MGAAMSAIGNFIGGRQSNEQQQEDFLSNQQFNASQAALNRTFQAGQQQQAENWMEMMSDTQMQRRVKDLNAAGLNPLLAIGQGGAAMGSIGTPGGSAASSGAIPSFQNALGNAANSAMQAYALQAQADAAKASADKTRSETPTPTHTTVNKDGEIEVVDPDSRGHELGDAQLAQIKANTGVSDATAIQVKANTDYINAQIKNTDAQTAIANIEQRLKGMSADILQATKTAVIDQANAAGIEAKNMMNLSKNPVIGPIISIIERLLPMASGALSIYNRAQYPTMGK